MAKLYKFLLLLLSPFIKIYFYSRCLYGKDRINSVKNHFGIATIKRPVGKLIWVHAASVGESTAALTFINHIKNQFPDLNVLLTTITVTSAEILESKISKTKDCYHQFVVADNPIWVQKFLDYWNVSLTVFLESEIWPNTVDELYRRNIPLFLLNARLSPRSFKRWGYFKIFLTSILRKFTCILAQSEIDAERYASFSPHNTKRIDNLKYSNALLPCNEDLLDTFKAICLGKRVLVAASTHEKEEDIIIEAHKKLRSEFDLITIIIPRHIDRIKNICDILKRNKVTYSLRSKVSKNLRFDSEVFCIDTFGEVGTFFRLADVCFVGGSLVPIGGHNIFEPVALGKPVLHGQFMDNALEVRDFLHEKKVTFEIKNSDEIYKICSEFFSCQKKLDDISKVAISVTKNESLKQIEDIIRIKDILY